MQTWFIVEYGFKPPNVWSSDPGVAAAAEDGGGRRAERTAAAGG